MNMGPTILDPIGLSDSRRSRGPLGFNCATRDLDVTDAIWVAAS